MARYFWIPLILALAGCGGSATTPQATTPTPAPTAAPTPVGPQRLYVPDDNTPGSVRVFTLPITSSSTPVASFSAPNSMGIAVNSSSVAVSTLGGGVSIYTQPVNSASTPATSFPTSGYDGLMTFASNGSLYETLNTNGAIFAPPFSSSSAPSSTLPMSTTVWGIAVDSAGTTYIGSNSNVVYALTGATVTATITGASTRHYRGIAVTSTQLLACSVGSSGAIDVYSLPVSSASTPVATITNGLSSSPEGCAADPSGNLYVADIGNAQAYVYEFTAPLSNSSSPAVALPVAGTPFALAVGP